MKCLFTPLFTLFFALLMGIAMPESATGANKRFTVVIDPGHGGSDIGAPGLITNEKTINLQVALLVGQLLKADNACDIHIIYTRDNDVFVPLQKRADIANKAGADLFVSIHANSVDKRNKNRLNISGASVYTLGLDRSETNLEVAMRENSVIKLENDYTTTYEGFDPQSSESYIIFELGQNRHMKHSIEVANEVQKQLISTAGRQDHGVRQANFWVLLKTAMPSILVELDFMCNPTQEKFMHSSEGRNKLAQAIANGILTYRKHHSPQLKTETPVTSVSDGSTNQPEPSITPDADTIVRDSAIAKTENAATVIESKIIYKIQFLSSQTTLATNSPKLHGLKPVECYKSDGAWKYTFGQYDSPAKAANDLKKIRKHFPDAFVIKTINGQRVK